MALTLGRRKRICPKDEGPFGVRIVLSPRDRSRSGGSSIGAHCNPRFSYDQSFISWQSFYRTAPKTTELGSDRNLKLRLNIIPLRYNPYVFILIIILVISDDISSISHLTWVVCVAALLQTLLTLVSPSPHPLLRLLSHFPTLPSSDQS
jgi:hypothetical protein